MCTLPTAAEPPAPPPPPPPVELKTNLKTELKPIPSIDPDICKWTEHPELREACAKNDICLHSPPFVFKHKYVASILQVGPTCGLVALSMLLNNDVTDDIFTMATAEEYTVHGEMFSCKNMLKLAEKFLDMTKSEVNYKLVNGDLFCDEIIKKLLDGALLLVPYDADCNHSPCLKRGHTAHWALICGIIIIDDPKESYTSDPNNVYVLAKHGKSRFLAAWNLNDLDKSNKNLWEFAPKRNTEGWVYALPEGGVGGENGLRNQFLIFEGL